MKSHWIVLFCGKLLKYLIPNSAWTNKVKHASLHVSFQAWLTLLLLSKFLLLFIFVIVCGIFEWKRICAGFFLMFIYIYICIAIGDPVIKREWLRSHFNPATFFVSVPSQDLDFQHHMSCLFFVFSERCLFVLLIFRWNCWQSLFKLSFH